jgi:hypothetical protein
MQEIWNNLMFILERFTWSSVLDILLVTIFLQLAALPVERHRCPNPAEGIFLIVILVFLLTSLVNLLLFRGWCRLSHQL